MIYAVGNQLYLLQDGSYRKHELLVNSSGEYYLEKVAGSLDKLPPTYQSLTFYEVVAQFGGNASSTPKKVPSKRTSD